MSARLSILVAIATILAGLVAVQQWRAAAARERARVWRLEPRAGRVVDTRGRPQAGFRVGFALESKTPHARWAAITDEHGAFTVGLPRLVVTVKTADRPLRDPEPLRIDLSRDPPQLPDIVVVSAEDWPSTLRGEVVDEQGRPIEGAEVALVSDDLAASDAAASADDGAFELRRTSTARSNHALVSCRHERYDAPADGYRAWGRDDLRLVMRPRVPVELRIVDDAGHDLDVVAITAELERDRRCLAPPPDDLRWADGAWRSDVCRGETRFLVELAATAAASWNARLPLRASVTDAGLAATFVLPRNAARVVRVVDPAGVPIEGSLVQLVAPRDGAVSATREVFGPESARGPAELDRARTDARGEATLRGPVGTELVVRARGPGHLPEVAGRIDLTEPEPFVVATRRGAHLRGRVRGDAELEALLRDGEWHLWLFTTAGREPWSENGSVLVAADGSFAIAGAPPGAWQPQLVTGASASPLLDGLLPTRGERLPELALADGDNPPITIDVSSWSWTRLQGRVLVDGEPLADEIVVIVAAADRAAPRSWVRARTDRRGRFDARVRHGSYVVRHGSQPWRSEPIEVAVGDGGAECVLELRTGRLELTLVDERGEPQRGRMVQLLEASDDLTWWPASADGDGIVRARLQPQPCHVAIVPEMAMRDAIAHAEHPLEAIREARIAFATSIVRAGETTRERLVVPASAGR